MSVPRQQVCQSASRKLLAALPGLRSVHALVGLDGFVDEIIAVVDKRYEQEPDRYEPVRTITAMGQKILRAAGQSSNYELAVKQIKLGGNGPIMANALAVMGLSITYIGSLGYPDLHPVFADFAKRARVISIAEAGHTDALEFEDGKLMLGKHRSLAAITWETFLDRVGPDRLTGALDECRLIAMTNWTMIPHMEQIWTNLCQAVASPGQRRLFFADLADPEKRTRQDILTALQLLAQMQQQVDVILGLNLKEATEIAGVLGLAIQGGADAAAGPLATAIRAKLGLSCVVVHPRGGAAATTAEQAAAFDGPFVPQPKISTGAGDHFNAGFCLGRVLGFTLEESLCTGVATSGYYVRTAQSPDGKQLADFMDALPEPQT
ncbi:MAG: PfkB family carbohydrate kinase [Tepidisphaeraceae bacterium]|jgi:sugar/nucleoside kinase (ribokinase family)